MVIKKLILIHTMDFHRSPRSIKEFWWVTQAVLQQNSCKRMYLVEKIPFNFFDTIFTLEMAIKILYDPIKMNKNEFGVLSVAY